MDNFQSRAPSNTVRRKVLNCKGIIIYFIFKIKLLRSTDFIHECVNFVKIIIKFTT